MRYDVISDGVDFYRKKGYVYLYDAPWIVEGSAYYSTKPPEAPDVSLGKDQFLVASGEQSFIQMMLEERHIKKAFCVTPCFRVEKYGEWKHPYFMKLELINADDPTLSNLVQMIHDAAEFFERYTNVRVIETTDARSQGPTFDIVDKASRNELGSYGIRKLELEGRPKLQWIYGTGVAEPRFSKTVRATREE